MVVERVVVVTAAAVEAEGATRACLQNGFGGDLELIVVKTRREEGAYSLKSVTDEQRRLNRNQPKDAPNAF